MYNSDKLTRLMLLEDPDVKLSSVHTAFRYQTFLRNKEYKKYSEHAVNLGDRARTLQILSFSTLIITFIGVFVSHIMRVFL